MLKAIRNSVSNEIYVIRKPRPLSDMLTNRVDKSQARSIGLESAGGWGLIKNGNPNRGGGGESSIP